MARKNVKKQKSAKSPKQSGRLRRSVQVKPKEKVATKTKSKVVKLPSSSVSGRQTVQKVVLPSACDAAAAGRMAAEFIAMRGNDIEVDASQVTQANVLALQVLLSAARTWKVDGKTFGLSHPGEKLSNALASLGLVQELFSQAAVIQ